MTSTVHDPFEVDSGLRDLTPAQVLDAVARAAAHSDREEAGCWRWRCTGSTSTGHSPTGRPRRLRRRRGSPVMVLGESLVEPALGGVGMPRIAEFAVEALAATLGLCYAAGLQLVSDAVELCFRLPRLWELVQAVGCRPGRPGRSPPRPPPVVRGGRVRGPAPRRDRGPQPDRFAGEASDWCTRRCCAATPTGPPGSSKPPWTPAGLVRPPRPPPPPPISPPASTPWTPSTSKPPSLTSPASWAGSATTARTTFVRPPHSACSPTPNAPSTSPPTTAPPPAPPAPVTASRAPTQQPPPRLRPRQV